MRARTSLFSWMLTGVTVSVLLGAFILQTFPGDLHADSRHSHLESRADDLTSFLDPDARMSDTLFTTSPCWLHIILDRQIVVRHWNDGRVDSFRVSSGNSRISKGIETRSGIYCIQSKSQLLLSRQFDNARMLWWLQFDGSIGFHGLDGRGYYRNLGVRPSSHGCVRMSQEDAKHLYESVPVGSPVLVSQSVVTNRVIGFLRDTTTVLPLTLEPDEARAYYDLRLALLTDGDEALEALPIVPLRKEYVRAGGLRISSAGRALRTRPGVEAFTSMASSSTSAIQPQW